MEVFFRASHETPGHPHNAVGVDVNICFCRIVFILLNIEPETPSTFMRPYVACLKHETGVNLDVLSHHCAVDDGLHLITPRSLRPKMRLSSPLPAEFPRVVGHN